MSHILIVEDDPSTANLYQETLTKQGYSVDRASNVNDAMAHLQNKSPDLILLDIMLPGGQNGFDFLEFIKHDQRWMKTPVIVMTNLDSEENIARQIGATDYLVKPDTSLDQLSQRVAKILTS